ncbi:ABC transporter permease subunit [Nocardiopsis composta]|uniref:Maltose/maltodextrin transport system permease protein n=1 Tax=Nocardiopsis composta TaxID=157465 RepID=A0A7W8VDL3_9ACTN|nr:ABC transporter permease subunit [Nocardiopsis composta]MBB5432160.1 arabinogalactan oligomer/maltooligosaccharide transport system permease protein [Nocardiopsis composta]
MATEKTPPPLPGGGLAPRGSLAGHLVKAVLLALSAGVAAWAAWPLYETRNWAGLGLVAAVTGVVWWVYLSKRRVPAKYLLPGVLLLIAFQVVPVVYTVAASATNHGDGHRGTKEEAIARIEASSVTRTADGREFTLTIAAEGGSPSGELVFLLTDEDGAVYAGDAEGLTPLPGARTGPTGRVLGADGYTPLTAAQANGRGAEVAELAVPAGDGAGIRAQGLSAAYEGRAARAYDAGCDCITDSATGAVYTADDEHGVFATEDGERLSQGWRVGVGADNYARLAADPGIASAFFSILGWNTVFAAGTTLGVFVLGLAVALALHTPDRLRGGTLYRLLLVLPYAMPAFAMMLLWRDMFNADFGLVNRLLGTDVDWLGGAGTARAVALTVNIWLGFPYMFLICTGALQAIPRELVQAARLDGAGAWQAFRQVTLPLLMVAVAPVLIATFAFNFNNFNAIWLTTKGGPFPSDSPTAGYTDLLITYTYRLAFGGQGAEYGYAAAVSVLIFLIVTLISFTGLRKSASLEEVNR